MNTTKRELSYPALAFLIGIPLGSAILIPMALQLEGFHWGVWIYFAIHWALDGFCVTGGYHRCFSHRCYEAATWVKVYFLIFGAGAFQNSALKWSIDHRRHHRHTDSEMDPYGIDKGFFWAHMKWIFYKDDPHVFDNVPADLKKDRLIQFQYKYYFLLAGLFGFGLPTLVCWLAFDRPLSGLAIGGFLRLFVISHCTYLINSAAHTWGRKTYNVNQSAKDNWFLSIFTFGEGFHNFHHAFQADYRNGVRWYHWDPTKWGIYFLSIFGSAKDLKRTQKEKIITARLKARELELQQKGYNTEKLHDLKNSLESLQATIGEMYREYLALRKDRSDKARKALAQLKVRMHKAQEDFYEIHKQWQETFNRILTSQGMIS